MGAKVDLPVPASVRGLVDVLAGEGHATVLVGGCVRDLVRGAPVADFDLATAAPPERVLSLFRRAVPIGLAHGTVMVPTAEGPVDVTSFRAGPRLEDDLALRDFTVNAMAYDPCRHELHDPFDGRGDLARGRLRAVRCAADRLAEDPLRALRAARLLATLGLAPDDELSEAMRGAREGLARVAHERIRSELARLLMGERAGEALALLRRTGLEARFAPDAAADASQVVDALPADLELRLAAWLRGDRVEKRLRQLRFSRRVCERVEHLLRSHPIEEGVDPDRDASVRRLLRRVGMENVAALVALRRAELAASPDPRAALRLDSVEKAVERVRQRGSLALRRLDLALSGSEVMEHLGCRPGPEVGRALAHLTDQVIEDPSRNTPEGLRALLDAWKG